MQMSLNFLKYKKSHWWQSCYLWAGYPRSFSFYVLSLVTFLFVVSAVFCLLSSTLSRIPICTKYLFKNNSLTVWVEGPLGFGLLLSCRIVQAFQLYLHICDVCSILRTLKVSLRNFKGDSKEVKDGYQ